MMKWLFKNKEEKDENGFVGFQVLVGAHGLGPSGQVSSVLFSPEVLDGSDLHVYLNALLESFHLF
ncbi:MAG: hypothetical protein HQ536_05265 [Parcubacteria group bacterium]|nr:hypothetical protein [Parcubacteria group bacterium]